ncbi:putative ribonuclease H-like domain-containing protein [Tanacetum coccineum]
MNMDLWSMSATSYIAITDHILWDIITNGDQATTDPASSSAPKTSLAANARRNNEKALNILLSAIPDRHLLSFHDAVDAKSLWTAIKARFGGNEASKKMQKNLLKQQFETFTIGSREELDSAYERFQNILSMLELYEAKVSLEDANLKFLRSLPSVWHVVATMIRGQPGLDELEFDDLYNNLKVYEHELKGVSNSSSQNIAFLSTEVKGSTLKQSTADPANILKGYTQAPSSKVQTAPNCASHSDEIICSFFAQQASMPTTHDDEDLLQIDEDAMEEIDIRWQVAMITARIRKFMRKTGRPIDLKPKNGITFDKNNRANGRLGKEVVAIEDSKPKAWWQTDNNEDIDWTKEFDAEPVTFAMMALTELKVDDWSMEFDSEHVHFGQDGLGDFDWSNIADDTPVSLALMATNSEARSEILGYQMSLESLEVILKTHEKNEYAWGDKYEQMEYDLKIRDLKLEEKQKELDQVLKERECYQGFGVESSSSENSDNSSGNTNSTESLANVSFTGIDELAIRNKVLNQENTKSSQPEIDRNKVIIEDWVDSDDEETGVNFSEIQKKTVVNSENMAGRPYYPWMDNIRPRTSSFSASSRSSTTRTPHRPQRPKKIMKSIWVKKASTVGPQAVLPQNGNPEEDLKDYAIIDSGCSGGEKSSKVLESISEGKEANAIEEGKKSVVNSTFTLKYVNLPFLKLLVNLLTDSDDDVPKDGVFSTNSFDDENTDTEGRWRACVQQTMDHTLMSLLLHLEIHKNHPQSQNYCKSTVGRMYKKQEEGVDYDEVFAPVARIEAIRLFLAFASFMGFIVYQMDVKSAFLYGNITEEVYVKQPPGFEDPAHPNKVYRVVKALYGLHQAPRAWYERLSTFLLKHGYRRGAIDKTLFIKKDRRDIMLVQVYVDDIIFGSTKSSMVKDFEDLMQKEFKMSSMGELTFFLGLQVKQTTAGIFLSQDKYVKDILNKFDFRNIKPASTPIEAHKSLGKDEEGEEVDVHLYRSMIGCLMYLTASRPDIMFAVCYVVLRVEYVAAASCCAQVLWMQNQLLDYGFNFMNTEIHIDNESTICIVRNPVLHSKTKHIQIRHHFIRDCYEQSY